MTNYIEEDVLAVVGLLCARIHWAGENPLSAIVELEGKYKKSYNNDKLADMFMEAYLTARTEVPDIVEQLGRSRHDAKLLQNTALLLQKAIENFNRDGSRKGGFLSGALFRRSKNPVRDVGEAIRAQLRVFSALIVSGKIKYSTLEKLAAAD